MGREELMSVVGNYRGGNGGLPGIDWLRLFRQHYKRIVWLNPASTTMWKCCRGWRANTGSASCFPYKLSVQG